jgi:hypothetical protein
VKIWCQKWDKILPDLVRYTSEMEQSLSQLMERLLASQEGAAAERDVKEEEMKAGSNSQAEVRQDKTNTGAKARQDKAHAETKARQNKAEAHLKQLIEDMEGRMEATINSVRSYLEQTLKTGMEDFLLCVRHKTIRCQERKGGVTYKTWIPDSLLNILA